MSAGGAAPDARPGDLPDARPDGLPIALPAGLPIALAGEALLEVRTTLGREEDALDLARALVEGGLAACVQVCAVRSVYRWEGAVHAEPEFRLACKTVAARYPALEAAIRARHPYALPAIEAVPVAAASAPFAQWVREGASGPD